MQQHTIDITSGALSPESWVYVWQDATTGEVIYVGATGLPLAARTWLHLNHDDPTIGHIRAAHPDALTGEVRVHGFTIDAALDRQAVKRAVQALVDGENPADEHQVTDVARRIVNATDA